MRNLKHALTIFFYDDGSISFNAMDSDGNIIKEHTFDDIPIELAKLRLLIELAQSPLPTVFDKEVDNAE